MPDVTTKAAAVEGALRDRPLPRLLQQLYRKEFTGHFVVADETRDESQVYMREGWVVHVGRPVNTDRLDNLLIEYGFLPADLVAQASAQIGENQRLGDVLERMGALDKQKLAQILKTQVTRKVIRLFFVAEGSYAVYLASHGFGVGDEFPLMRVDPRTLVYPGIRAAYGLPRATRELARLAGQRFRLADISPAFVTALGIAADDTTVEALRAGWMTLDDLDGVTSRPFEVRSVVLALYYADSLDREAITTAPTDSFAPESTSPSRTSGIYRIARAAGDSGPGFNLDSGSSSESLRPDEQAAPAPAAAPAAPPAVAEVAKPAAPAPTRPAEATAFPSGAPPVASAPVLPRPPAKSAGNGNGATAGGGAPAVPGFAPTRPPLASPPRPAVRAAPPAPAKPAPAPPSESLRASILEMATKLDKSTHFEILGVSQSASSDDVSAAFVRAARQFHPDRLIGAGLSDLQPQAERILARINEAVMVLQNPGRRAEYVASLAGGAPQTAQNLPTLLEAENLFLKGEVFLKKGDHAKAIEAFALASKGNPEEPQYRAYLAWARFDDPRGRKEAAVRDTLKVLEGVVRERPRFARGFYWLGQLWKFLNEAAKAEQAFREAVQIDATFIEAGRELRLIGMRKNKSGTKPGRPEPPHSGGLMGKFWKR